MSGILESLNQISGATITAVLNSFWQAVALAAVAWLVMRFAPRMNAATRHIYWWALLALLTVLPFAPRIARPRAANAVAPAAQALPTDFADSAPAPIRPAAPVPPVSQAPLEISAGLWPAAFLALWVLLLLTQSGRVAWSYLYLRRVKRQAHPASPELRRNFDAWVLSCRVRRPVRLLISSEIVSPMAVGFRDPAVILPEQLLQEFQEPELDHVLLHELAHIARRDDWTNLAARLAAGVLAFHPVAAWVLRSIERERELACDDWVVSMTGEPRPYAASLARLFELCFSRRRMMLASGMADSASHLGRRIEKLLRRNSGFTPRASSAPIIAGVATLVALVIAGAQAPGWFAFAQDRIPPEAPEAAPAPMAERAPAAAPAPAAAQAAPAPEAAPALPAPPAPPDFDDRIADLRRQMSELRQSLTANHPRMVRLRSQIAALEAGPEPPGPPQAAAPSAPPQAPDRNSFLAALSAAGYGNLSVDEIISLKNAGVSAEFLRGISESGWGRISTEELIGLTQRGVRPDYVRRMKDAGLKDLSLRNVMEMASAGASPETIQEIHSLGFGPYTTAQAIQFAQHGIRAPLFRALKEGGYGNVTPHEIIEAAQVGLSARDLREAKQYGSGLTLKQVIRLKTVGVF